MSNPDAELFRILIVDDEPLNIKLLGNLLKNAGYSLEFATNGEKALEWMREESFDLILLDVMMPGMDGFEVCETLKADPMRAHIPIIFLTARSEQEDILKGFEVGGSDYVTKPFNSPELLARIRVQVELKLLRGFIPICSNCKNVRDDEGEWEKIEHYVESRSKALFSHTVCPTCMETLYGQDEWYQKKFKNKL
jgi:CheY-like chemotaxis protein